MRQYGSTGKIFEGSCSMYGYVRLAPAAFRSIHPRVRTSLKASQLLHILELGGEGRAGGFMCVLYVPFVHRVSRPALFKSVRLLAWRSNILTYVRAAYTECSPSSFPSQPASSSISSSERGGVLFNRLWNMLMPTRTTTCPE